MAADKVLKEKVASALNDAFPGARVGVFDGYLTNVHAIVVAHQFASLTDAARQDRLWEVLERALTPGEMVRVSLALAFTPEEPEADRAFAEHAGH